MRKRLNYLILNGETEDQTSLTPEISETKEEEDDLEIPAFLRRQKN